MMMRANVFPVLGNHEYMMAHCARFLLQEVTDESIARLDSDTLQGLTEWMNIGGSVTIGEFHRLSVEERYDILDYLEEFSLYEEVQAAGKTFVLVHAGLANFDAGRDQYRDEIFVKNHHIAIDCGCGYDGKLGCVCLETMEQYYV